LTDITRRSLSFTEHKAEQQGVIVDVDLPSSLPVNADSNQLVQVILNLFVNALHAMEGPGRIHVTGGCSAGVVRVALRDSGPGVPEGLKARVWDPFFTTKPEGIGTGLGLSVSQGILREHGGDLVLADDEAAGACFVVTLPARVEDDRTGSPDLE
jgi:two-component system, NtrC family, sensor kinase